MRGRLCQCRPNTVIVRSDVINVNAQTAKAIYDNAQADYSGMKTFTSGGVTKQQLDQARLTLTNAGSNLKQNINVGDI
jgi:hypothetical protein